MREHPISPIHWQKSPGPSLFERLRKAVGTLHRRLPDAGGAGRWHAQVLAGRPLRFAQPITFTPYAAVQPCSARCRFCSENLRIEGEGTPASMLRPQAGYFDGLQQTLRALNGVPLNWSLSGLETSDDAPWMLQLLTTLAAAEQDGALVQDRVLYSNGAGFAQVQGDALREALLRFGLSWLELSRHHHDGAINQSIMRFRPGLVIGDQAVFQRTARTLATRLPVRLVCILQKGGVATPGDVADYLGWARNCGADTVVFREFSRLDAGYRDNATARYIGDARVAMEALLLDCLEDPASSGGWTLESLTEGYYFWNLRLRTADGMNVIFECADYGAMHRRHATGDIYKLVYFPNGQLCSGWSPGQDVLLDTRAMQEADDGQR